MSTAKDLAARAAKLSQRPEEPPAHRQAPPPRASPVRLSVDVSPLTYRAVTSYPEEMNLPEATGRARIPTVEVFRALAEELAVNKDLRNRVAERIRNNLAK